MDFFCLLSLTALIGFLGVLSFVFFLWLLFFSLTFQLTVNITFLWATDFLLLFGVSHIFACSSLSEFKLAHLGSSLPKLWLYNPLCCWDSSRAFFPQCRSPRRWCFATGQRWRQWRRCLVCWCCRCWCGADGADFLLSTSATDSPRQVRTIHQVNVEIVQVNIQTHIFRVSTILHPALTPLPIPPDTSHQYDVFLVHGNSVYRWVWSVLLPTLEDTFGYTCFLPQRDMCGGDSE